MSVPPASPLLDQAYRLADNRMVDETPYYDEDSHRKPNMEVFVREFFEMVEKIKPESVTPNVLMGELNDAQWMCPGIDKIVAELQKLDRNGDTIRLSSIPDYFGMIKRSKEKLQTFKGEMRYPFKQNFAFRLCNVLSTRMYLKQLNRQAEYLLTAWTEPFNTFASLLGSPYPQAMLFDAWKKMHINHSHDDIGGCSVDYVHEDMLWRYRQVTERCRGLLHRSLGTIARQVGSAEIEKNQSRLVVFNPLASGRNNISRFYVDVPLGIECKDIQVADSKGNTVASEIISSSMDKSSPLELQLSGCPAVPIKRYNIEVSTANIPSMGYSQYTLTALPQPAPKAQPLPCGRNWMENEFLKASFNSDGTLNLLDKKTGQSFENLHYFQDCGQDRAARISWYLIYPAQDKVYNSKGIKAEISVIHNSSLSTSIKVDYCFNIPKSLDLNNVKMVKQEHFTSYRYEKRSDELIPLKITSIFTLNAGSRRVDVETTLDNQATDHWLRVMFPTKVKTDSSYADSAFDVVKRPVEKFDTQEYIELKTQGDVQTFPMLTFADLASDERSLAVLVNGLPDYDIVDGDDRTIAVSLLRAIFNGRIDPETKMPQVNSSQCLGIHSYQYAIYPHKGTWDKAAVLDEALDHNLPLMGVQLMGKGTGTLPTSASFISFSKPGLVISALKKAQSGDGIVLRLYNPSAKAIETDITFSLGKLASVQSTNLLEEPLPGKKLKIDKSGKFHLSAGPKKIVTLLLTCK
jgi:alpha-mannosidase